MNKNNNTSIIKHDFFKTLTNSYLYLTLAVIFFIIFRWEALNLPYFWDEAWSYIPAIDAMIQTKPCLIPNCIDPELYRGHPLLFYFLASSWGIFFGNSLVSLHSFALLISILTIFSFFRVCKLFFAERYALIMSIILMLQTIFIVQSTFLLPEILIALLTLEIFYAYHQKQYIYFILTGALLGLTKESGIIILGVFCLFHFINIFQEKKHSFLNYTWVSIPFLPIILFYSYQRWLLGWFLFPLHSGMIDITWYSVKNKAMIILSFIFIEQGRLFLWIILIFALISSLLFFKNNKPKMAFTKDQYRLVLFSNLFFLLYVIFSATNFLMLRYLLCLFPFVLLCYALVFSKLLAPNFKGFLLLTLLIPLFLWSSHQNRSKSWVDDASMNAFDMIKVHKELVAFLEQEAYYDKQINTHFLMWYNLTKPALSYLSSELIFQNVKYDTELSPDTDIVIISRIELKSAQHDKIKGNPSFELIKRFENGMAWSEIFARKQNK